VWKRVINILIGEDDCRYRLFFGVFDRFAVDLFQLGFHLEIHIVVLRLGSLMIQFGNESTGAPTGTDVDEAAIQAHDAMFVRKRIPIGTCRHADMITRRGRMKTCIVPIHR